MEAPALANFYDLTDDAPVAQLPEVLTSEVASSSSDDSEDEGRRFVRWAKLVPSTAAAAAQPAARPAAAAARERSSSDEDAPIARRVKQRTGRRRASHFAGSYQDLATQQHLAREEQVRLADTVEIRDAGAMGDGLFALRDLQPGELQLSYFGKHYASETQYLEDYPNDDGVNTLELRGEYFDGTPIDSLARRINHRVPGNMEFVEDESSTYAQLELIKPVHAGEQLFVDYGPAYPYREHRFAR